MVALQKFDIVEYDVDRTGGSVRQIVKNALKRCRIYVFLRSPDVLTEHLRQLFEMLNINCVIDVGAHYGEFGRSLRSYVGYRGRIASFEPGSEAYEKLERRAAGDPEWRTINCALGSASDQKEMNVVRYTAVSSFLAPSQFAIEEFNEQIDVVGREKVKVRTLDEMFKWCVDGIQEPRVYLKLDTQGYDLEVLRGATTTIGGILAMQSEVSLRPIYDGMPRMSEAIQYFENLGFLVTGLFTVTRAKDLSAIEFDCVLRR